MLPPRNAGFGYVQTLQTVKATTRALLVLLILSISAIIALSVAMMSSRDWITVYVPPDLSRGAVITAGEPSHATVHAFAWQTLQQLYHWPADGQVDYPAAIREQSDYLTPDFRHQLNREREQLTNRAGINELRGRTRALHPVPGIAFTPEAVTRQADGLWLVTLEFRLVETIDVLTIKDLRIRYRLRVVRADVDPRGNQWGLQLDGFLQEPERLGQGRHGADPEEFS